MATGSQTVFANRIAWAVQYLKSAAAVQSVARGIYEITPRGQALSEGSPGKITLAQLQTPPYAKLPTRALYEWRVTQALVARRSSRYA